MSLSDEEHDALARLERELRDDAEIRQMFLKWTAGPWWLRTPTIVVAATIGLAAVVLLISVTIVASFVVFVAVLVWLTIYANTRAPWTIDAIRGAFDRLQVREPDSERGV